MPNDAVVFSRGLAATMPATYQEGRFLLQTDTGALFLDDTASSRIQIKDTTKLPLTGGTIDNNSAVSTKIQPGQITLIPKGSPGKEFLISITGTTGQVTFNSGSTEVATISSSFSYLSVDYDYGSSNPFIGNAVTNKNYVDTSIQSNAVPATTTDNTDYTVAKNVNFTGATEVGALSVGTINATGNLTLSDSVKSQWQSVLGIGSGGGGNYLPLSGGTLSGNVVINNTSGDAQVSLQGIMAQGQISASSSIAPLDKTISFNYRTLSSEGWSTIFSYSSTGIDMKNNSITNYVIDDGSID